MLTRIMPPISRGIRIGVISFLASMLSYHHTLNYPKGGDFLVDEQYVFEIGGKSKTKQQIKAETAAWVVADGLEIGAEGKIPLWLFRFLY